MSTATSPFKFLDSYNQKDKDIFFGREKETEALYEALSGVKHLLVYGPSGAGKTSIVECGLRNQFSDADWYALTIRKGANMSASVFASINEKLKAKIDLNPETQLPRDPDLDFGQAIERLFSERFQPIYLLFDQFEELLITGTEEEKRDFFVRLNQLIRYKVPCRMMLIMREEFIGHLSEFEPLCPSIFQHRFRVEKMRKDSVREVIIKTLDAPLYRKDYKVMDAEALADSIIAKLPDGKREIELAHLQVFLGELWGRANLAKNGDALPLLQQGLIQSNDNLEGVLDSFLKTQIKELGEVYGEKVPMELLDLLISGQNTKLQLAEIDLQNGLATREVVMHQPLRQLLDDLIRRRTLRTLKVGDETQYEISHDVLALVVGQNRTNEMKLREKAADIYRVYGERQGDFSQSDLDYLRPYGVYLAFSEGLEKRIFESEGKIAAKEQEELSKKQTELVKARKRFRTVVALLGLAVFALLFAVFQTFNAQSAKNEAIKKAEETEDAKALADSSLQIANTLVNAFYFYDGKFALAYGQMEESGQPIFYFINRNGIEVPKLGKWVKAEQFSKIGFAKVSKNEGGKLLDYLLDTLGNTYRVAFDINDVCEEVFALDLSGKQLTGLPVKIFTQTHLKILLLSSNQLTILSERIGELKGLTILDLSENLLASLPEQIGDLRSLKNLNLASNELTRLPERIEDLKGLTILSLRGNRLTSLPERIQDLKGLTNLDLANNQLTILPEQLLDLKNLTFLNLELNELTCLPKQIGELKNLTTLNLRFNELTSLPKKIGELKNLTTLNLSDNQLSNLSDEIGELKNLTNLNLSHNKVASLPERIGELKNLTTLILTANRLTTLSERIGELKNLTNLNLASNGLTRLPERIEDLKGLTILSLRGNRLTSLPEQIWELKNLTSLDLSFIQLTSLPERIGELENLRSLDLSLNQLANLPERIWELKHLTSLDLSSIQLTSLPERIRELKDLTSLDLSSNQLTSLPERVWELESLTALNLHDNLFTHLPEQIGELKNLTGLGLSRNKLTSLPERIGDLKRLTYLSLADNHLTSLPERIGELKLLSELNLIGNPISKEAQATIQKLLPNCKITFTEERAEAVHQSQ
jgi:Leucine-rich repeat (LRR) protein